MGPLAHAKGSFLEHVTTFVDTRDFRLAVLSGPRRKADQCKKVTVRRVVIRKESVFQVTTYDEHKGLTRNIDRLELLGFLATLAEFDFKYGQLEAATYVDNLIVSKKGKVHATRTVQESSRSTDHDRRKSLPLSGPDSQKFLQAIGLTNADGTLKSDRARKYRQINEFVRLVTESDGLSQIEHDPVDVVDLGCGNAYLTFALHHFLNEVLGRRARLTGVDSRQEPLCKHQTVVTELGLENLSFVESRIAEADLVAADIVVALHACDTATDEAIFQGIRLGSTIIVVVPCCHQNLQKQLRVQLAARDNLSPMKPLKSFGLLEERLGDILTDTCRSLILEAFGYQCDVVQFATSEDSARNLMIRGILRSRRLPTQKFAEYCSLRDFWGVTPHLETLLTRARLWPLEG